MAGPYESLILVTMCHGTWYILSQTKCLGRFLRTWKDDNAHLQVIGLWTMAAAMVLHVYSALLPSAIDSYEIDAPEATGVTWPAQVSFYLFLNFSFSFILIILFIIFLFI